MATVRVEVKIKVHKISCRTRHDFLPTEYNCQRNLLLLFYCCSCLQNKYEVSWCLNTVPFFDYRIDWLRKINDLDPHAVAIAFNHISTLLTEFLNEPQSVLLMESGSERMRCHKAMLEAAALLHHKIKGFQINSLDGRLRYLKLFFRYGWYPQNFDSANLSEEAKEAWRGITEGSILPPI